MHARRSRGRVPLGGRGEETETGPRSGENNAKVLPGFGWSSPSTVKALSGALALPTGPLPPVGYTCASMSGTKAQWREDGVDSAGPARSISLPTARARPLPGACASCLASPKPAVAASRSRRSPRPPSSARAGATTTSCMRQRLADASTAWWAPPSLAARGGVEALGPNGVVAGDDACPRLLFERCGRLMDGLDAAPARAAPAGFGSVGDRSSRPAASARRWWRQPTRPLCPMTTVQDGDDDADEFLALPLQLADRD